MFEDRRLHCPKTRSLVQVSRITVPNGLHTPFGLFFDPVWEEVFICGSKGYMPISERTVQLTVWQVFYFRFVDALMLLLLIAILGTYSLLRSCLFGLANLLVSLIAFIVCYSHLLAFVCMFHHQGL